MTQVVTLAVMLSPVAAVFGWTYSSPARYRRMAQWFNRVFEEFE